MVTNDFFEQMKKSKVFYEKNVVENEKYYGYDIMVNIDTGEQQQLTHLAMDLYTHKERYGIGARMLGIDNLVKLAPAKVIKAIEKKGLNNLDPHLNGIVNIDRFDDTFCMFGRLMGKNKNKLSKYDIIDSKCCWTCLIKEALRIKYKEA